MLLTHYSRVTDVERLGSDLQRRVGELAALGRAAQGKPERAALLRAGVRELLLGWVHDHGSMLAPAQAEELLALDIRLNAQGIESWLDRRQ